MSQRVLCRGRYSQPAGERVGRRDDLHNFGAAIYTVAEDARLLCSFDAPCDRLYNEHYAKTGLRRNTIRKTSLPDGPPKLCPVRLFGRN